MTNSPVSGVVRRGGAERLHVGAVAGLGHREAAEQPAVDQVVEVGVVVRLRAELQDRAAEQAELHADLDHHGQVAERRASRRPRPRRRCRRRRRTPSGSRTRSARCRPSSCTTSSTRSRKSSRDIVRWSSRIDGVLGEVGSARGRAPRRTSRRGSRSARGHRAQSSVGHAHMFPPAARLNRVRPVTPRVSRPHREVRVPGVDRVVARRSRRCAAPRGSCPPPRYERDVVDAAGPAVRAPEQQVARPGVGRPGSGCRRRTARRSSAAATCRRRPRPAWSARSSPTSSGRWRPSGRARPSWALA